MTLQNELQQILRSKALFKRALQGAAIAFILINVLLFIGRKYTMEHVQSWEYLAIGAVTLGGAFGGLFYSLMDILRVQGGRKKLIANIISVVAFLVICYLSLVLSLNATGQWD